IVMILQLINQVQQAGTFWVANQFIWGWLLLPVLTLGQLVKQDAATNNGLTSERVNGYLWITLGIIAVWILTAPLWNSFIANVMGIENPESITSLVWLMVGFYVIFSLNNVIDSYFYGIGRTDLMLYQSLIVNTLFYGCAFVLYQIGIFVPTLERIAIMFGLGITADALITWVLYLALRSKESMNQQPVRH
ncbi:multidrug transporter, partial [Vibrio parahaemolyticus]|nr:multidrug transporter [Vibrio parahaemolyticus]